MPSLTRYYVEKMPQFLAHKPPERIRAALDWTGAYCRDVLPGIVIDRRDPVVTNVDASGDH